jgi:xanthine dehydrogenase accessory factor
VNPTTAEALIHTTVLGWLEAGRRAVAATLVGIDGSAPLDPGATMWLDESGAIEGSVTGGCVEGALVEVGRHVLDGQAPGVHTYGISDELAGEVGLMCGGTVRIFVAAVDGRNLAPVRATLAAAAAQRPAALATVLDGPAAGNRLAVIGEETIGTLGVSELMDRTVGAEARGVLTQGTSLLRSYGADGATMGDDIRVFIQAFAEAPRMVIFGAIDFSAALAMVAKRLGYAITICDPRRAFIASDRFSAAAQVSSAWPDEYLRDVQLGPRDAVLVFTHDAKLDEPALIAALGTGAGYIGALGSRRTQRERHARLVAAGVPEAQLERIVAPCGLDIGAATPGETAISILAEIVALRAGRHGDRLVETEGAIRRRAEVMDPA